MVEEPKRLGRGLAALLGASNDDLEAAAPRGLQRKAPVEFLRPNTQNPRKEFDEADLEDLAASIRQRGILQPIIVRSSSSLADVYEIIAGERRWRAAQRAGLHEVPIIVVSATDKEALELAIIENVQRTDLNPLEEAIGYERLAQDYGYTHSDIAAAIGKSRSHVANMVRLTKLPDNSKALLRQGKISSGHARALLAVQDPDSVAENIIQKGLTVRDVERIAQVEARTPDRQVDGKKKAAPPDADTRAIERKIADALGLSVAIRSAGAGGTVTLKYNDLEQFDMICDRLCGPSS